MTLFGHIHKFSDDTALDKKIVASIMEVDNF